MADVLHKSGLIAQVAKDLNYPKTKVADVVDAAFEAIAGSLADGSEVNIKGFGKWTVSKRPAKKGHKAPNGTIVDIPAYSQARFKAGRTLKKTVKNIA